MRTDSPAKLSVLALLALLAAPQIWAQTNALPRRPLPPPPPLPPLVRTNFAALTNRPIPFRPRGMTNQMPAVRPTPGPAAAQPALAVPPATKLPAPVVTAAAPSAPPTPPMALVFDAEAKEHTAQPGEMSIPFTFHLTNVWTNIVLVNSLRTSCGCTVASLPSQPWRLAPGSNGPIRVSVNIAGKRGKITKSVSADTSSGIKSVLVSVTIPEPTNATPAVAAGSTTDPDRQRNMILAMADRQVVFKNDCAKCHAEPGHGKMGKELYTAVCAICHDSPHRATAVPDLRALKHPTNAAHWRTWTASGRIGTMMPAFSQKEGGPLTEEQVNSLVTYLVQAFPSVPQSAAASPTGPVSDSSVLPASGAK